MTGCAEYTEGCHVFAETGTCSHGVTITVSAADRQDAIEALRSLAVCAEGDSNDDEIEAGRNCADILQSILGITSHELSTEDA